MSSNGNIFRVTGHLCGEFTGDRWIPRTKASDTELWYFLCRPNKRLSKHSWRWCFGTPSRPLWRHWNRDFQNKHNDVMTSYLLSCPMYYRESHWLSMGLTEISRVTWQVYVKKTPFQHYWPFVRIQRPGSVMWSVGVFFIINRKYCWTNYQVVGYLKSRDVHMTSFWCLKHRWLNNITGTLQTTIWSAFSWMSLIALFEAVLKHMYRDIPMMSQNKDTVLPG